MPTGGAGLLPGLAVRGDSRGIWCAGAPSKYDNDVAIDSYAKRRCGWVVTGFRRVVVWLNLTATWRY